MLFEVFVVLLVVVVVYFSLWLCSFDICGDSGVCVCSGFNSIVVCFWLWLYCWWLWCC